MMDSKAALAAWTALDDVIAAKAIARIAEQRPELAEILRQALEADAADLNQMASLISQADAELALAVLKSLVDVSAGGTAA